MHQAMPGGIRDGCILAGRTGIPAAPPGSPAGKNCQAALNRAQIDVRLRSPHGGDIIIALQDYGAVQWNYLAACRTW
jgi:hypothetical protein